MRIHLINANKGIVKWIRSQSFEQLARLIALKPSSFTFIVDKLETDKMIQFMNSLIEFDRTSRENVTLFKLDILFKLTYDPTVQRSGKMGLTITPFNAALMQLREKKLIVLLRELGHRIIFSTQSALNFLSLLKFSPLDDKRKNFLIDSMLNRIIEITENDDQFTRVFNALPKQYQKNAYANRTHRVSEEDERSQQITMRNSFNYL